MFFVVFVFCVVVVFVVLFCCFVCLLFCFLFFCFCWWKASARYEWDRTVGIHLVEKPKLGWSQVLPHMRPDNIRQREVPTTPQVVAFVIGSLEFDPWPIHSNNGLVKLVRLVGLHGNRALEPKWLRVMMMMVMMMDDGIQNFKPS